MSVPKSYEKLLNEPNLKTDLDEEEIFECIKDILEFIPKTCKAKLEYPNKSFSIILQENEFLKDIQAQIPYIMSIYDYNDYKIYYNYIIKVFRYYIKEIIEEKETFSIKNYIYKDLIDICNIMKLIIIKNKKCLKDNDIKFYFYHIINTFTFSERKIEKSNIFFKMGIKILSKNYQIKDYDNKYFPENIKINSFKDFLKAIKDLVDQCLNVYNDKINKNLEFICNEFVVKIKDVKNTIQKFIINLNDNGQIPSKENIALSLLELYKALGLSPIWKIVEFNPYISLIPLLLNHFNGENDFDILYPICFINIKKEVSQIKTIPNELHKGVFVKSYKNALKYLLIFDKYDKINSILNNENNENLSGDFKTIIKDKNFQQKVINFFDSESMKTFLGIKIDKELILKIEKEYINFIKYIATDSFWNSIMFYTLPKYTKAFVSNYMRIVINDNYIIFSGCKEKEKKDSILEFILFELIIHELLHFLRRYCLENVESKKALTPPNSEEADKKKSGEIGEELIKYYFGIPKINSITYQQAIEFKKLSFVKPQDFDELKRIIKMKPSLSENFAYAKFINTSPKIKDEVYAIIEGDCLNSSRISKFSY